MRTLRETVPAPEGDKMIAAIDLDGQRPLIAMFVALAFFAAVQLYGADTSMSN